MKILMSAFVCAPGYGSEAAVGWNMALETAHLGHDVVVLTSTAFRTDIERELASGKLPKNLHIHAFSPAWLERVRDAGLAWGFSWITWHLVHFLWQFYALSHARRSFNDADFELVHHVSYAGIRHPTLLTRLGLPTVIGPLGGGESAPMQLRKTFPWKAWCGELLRDIHTSALRVDPITRLAFRDAKLIFLRTEESAAAVPPRYRNKVHIDIGTGITEVADGEALPRTPREQFRLLFAGRLLWWKGVHLALRALAKARAEGIDATLTIVGGGPARHRLEKMARKLGISEHVAWLGKIPQQELLAMYRRYHAFLFPSLHDAGPTVVLESLAHGLPVVCLALGGTTKMVDATCGCLVPVDGRSEDECVARIGSEIVALATNEAHRLALSRGAIDRSREFLWPKTVARLYGEIARRLQCGGLEASRVLQPTPVDLLARAGKWHL